MDAPLSSPTRQQAQRTASQWPQSTHAAAGGGTTTTGFGAVVPPPLPLPTQQAKTTTTTPSTDALLKDFSLVAEAAKLEANVHTPGGGETGSILRIDREGPEAPER
ncbi:hypothetical protein VPNG_05453 [Cytospora leucostoma]|uniref:Uncharacterized protein n=1 Tax=Cytospora leucostoma TaxID=1230097 RepID=A0A423XBK1_9PEZI|nr:hypothetical protein VPNG_05453 [Cytospora leucostoma]